MDRTVEGISIISSKGSDPNMASNSSNVYTNQGYSSANNFSSIENDAMSRNRNKSSNSLNGGGSHSNNNSSNNLNNVSNTKMVNTNGSNIKDDNNGGGDNVKVNMDIQSKARKYEDSSAFFPMKKEGSNSNVEFTLPAHGRGRERSKSLGSDGGPYRGMGKEELLRHSSRPLWRNLRYACMSIVLTGWLALLITVVALVLTYPQCRTPQRKDWWQKTVVYRIYVRSFMDSGRDGVGDLQGIIHKLDYLKETGVGTISLSPIYRLAQDAPEDSHIVNHTDIDPVFGTMADFTKLVNETHRRGMNLILDFIPNHTSDQHPWFIKSKSDGAPRGNIFSSYYVWQKGGGPNGINEPPNTWKSFYDCSAWELTPENSNKFYLHQFLKSQPDLNLRSEKVREELEDILKFWLDLGVDGFYIKDVDFLFEDYDFREDENLDNSSTVSCDGNKETYPYNSYSHTYTRGLDELFDMLARWRYFLDEYGNKTHKYKMLISDVDADLDHVMHYYGLFNRDGVDFPLNKFSLDIKNGSLGVASMVNSWLSHLPAGRWANWMGGDDQSPRLADRLGSEMSKPYLVMTIFLPGTPFLYYGDEIGMRASPINTSSSAPPNPGDREKPMRGPMLWNNQTNAGFCPNYCQHPWMSPYANYSKGMGVNVQAKQNDPYSEWHLLKNLTDLRRKYAAFQYGDYVGSIQDQQVFSFVREFDGEKGFLVALNFANTKIHRHFTGTHSTIPSGGKIEIVTGKTSRRRGDGIDLDPLILYPYQGVVISWDYKAKEI